MTNTLRCSICDRTNSIHVQNLPGGYVGSGNRTFVTDDKTKQLVCLSCIEEIRDALSEFRDEEKEVLEGEEFGDLNITYLGV